MLPILVILIHFSNIVSVVGIQSTVSFVCKDVNHPPPTLYAHQGSEQLLRSSRRLFLRMASVLSFIFLPEKQAGFRLHCSIIGHSLNVVLLLNKIIILFVILTELLLIFDSRDKNCL